MTAKNAIGIVLLWGVTFALMGGAIGAALGVAAPDYYRTVFHQGRSPDFNPFQVGVGLGVTQGLASGVAIALGVLALLGWRDLRNRDTRPADESAGTGRSPRRWTRLALCGAAASVVIVICCTAAFLLGGIVGQQQLYQTWTERKLRTIATILDPHEFPNIQTGYSSAAQVYLTGDVETEATRQALRDKLVLAFGSDEADEMIWRVDVEQ